MSSQQQLVCDNITKMESFEENASGRVPAEIWMKIFKLEPEPRKLSTLRRVCKQWQDVIDDNFEMKVKINEDKMDVSSVYHFKRVTKCIVSKFLREDISPSPPSHQIFWNPEILSSVILRGPISRPNFLVIAQQCTNVKQLFLTGILLVGHGNIFEAKSNKETNVLSKFMGGLEKLVVNGLHVGSSESHPMTPPVNLFSLLNWPMAELKHLVVRVSFPDAAEDKKYFQLLENCRLLESIEFTLRNYRDPLQFTPFVLPNLTTLKIELRVKERLVDWLPFISAQQTIQSLKIMITLGGGFELDDPVVEAILKNGNSLQSLEMRKLSKINYWSRAQFFGGMANLRSLTLQGVEQPRISYLNLLPESMETLVLDNFEVRREEIELISGRVGLNLRTRNIKQ